VIGGGRICVNCLFIVRLSFIKGRSWWVGVGSWGGWLEIGVSGCGDS